MESKKKLKLIFFTQTDNPTAVEKTRIAILEGGPFDVVVRSARVAALTLYGANIEKCDYVCGITVPAAYVTAGIPSLQDNIVTNNLFTLTLLPATAEIDLSNNETVKLTGIVKFEPSNGLAFSCPVDQLPGTFVQWSSSAPTKATVDSVGVVAPVATGTATITCKLPSFASGDVSDTTDITVVA